MRPSWRVAFVLALVLMGWVSAGCFALQRHEPPVQRTARIELPTVLQAPGGPVRVIRTRDIVVGGDSAWGAYYEAKRVILIDSTAPPLHQLKVYYHEATHVALSDAGLDDLLDARLVESLSNAIGTARLVELQGQLPR